jgi:hypothetical protein
VATTFQSEYGKLKTLYLKRAKDAFVNDAQIDAQWKDLNFLSKPGRSDCHRPWDDYL